MTAPVIHNLNTLRNLLESLARLDRSDGKLPPQKADELAESFRDCRLELIRLAQAQLSDEQLHRLEQMDYRLQMVVSGHGLSKSIAPEAERALNSFGWTPAHLIQHHPKRGGGSLSVQG